MPDGFPKDWQNRQGYFCGFVHSGIPACCVVFFMQTWLPYVAALTAANSDLAYLTSVAITKAFGYVPCPKCTRAARFVKLQKCNCNK